MTMKLLNIFVMMEMPVGMMCLFDTRIDIVPANQQNVTAIC